MYVCYPLHVAVFQWPATHPCHPPLVILSASRPKPVQSPVRNFTQYVYLVGESASIDRNFTCSLVYATQFLIFVCHIVWNSYFLYWVSNVVTIALCTCSFCLFHVLPDPTTPNKRRLSRHSSFEVICDVAEQERNRLYFESKSLPAAPVLGIAFFVQMLTTH